MRRELVCTFNHHTDFVDDNEKLLQRSKIGRALTAALRKDGRVWVVANPMSRVSKMFHFTTPADFLLFLRHNFYIAITLAKWSFFRIDEKRYEIQIMDCALRLTDITDHLDVIIGKQRPVTNVETSIYSHFDEHKFPVLHQAHKNLERAGFSEIAEELLGEHLAEELLGGHLSVAAEPIETGDRAIDQHLNRMQIISRYVRLVQEEKEVA